MSFVPQRYNAADPDVTTSAMQAAPTKTTPVDADGVSIIDSAASNAFKRVLWSQVKATLKTYFDTLYSAASWGSITGTLSSQTDLQTALNAKAGTASPTFTGTVNAAAITASGIVDARTAITGHRLGHFGHQDSVTVGWPGSSFGGYQCGSNGIVSWLGMGLSLGANASGVVEVNSGTNVAFGGSLRDLTLRSLTASGTVRLGTYTVATLPSASANTRARAFVTDSNLAFNSTNLGSTVTAGGSTLVPVFSNGTNWVIG